MLNQVRGGFLDSIRWNHYPLSLAFFVRFESSCYDIGHDSSYVYHSYLPAVVCKASSGSTKMQLAEL